MKNNIIKYTDLIIFYFSGTGNAKISAKWIAQNAKTKNIKTKIINIAKENNFENIKFNKQTLIGFCYPTHGFNAPPVMLKFIRKFPKSKYKNNIFLLNTRAGGKISKIFTPGLSGIAEILPALMLKIKVYKIVGFIPVDLPSNWISVHPSLNKKTINLIFKKWHKVINKKFDKIFEGKKIYNGLYSLPIDLAISPISFAYYIIGRFAIAKTFFASYDCNSCGLCKKICPVQAIKFINNRPFWSFKCESCMKCMNNCPKRAIETAHLYVIILWWLSFSIIPVSIFAYLEFYIDIHRIISEILFNVIGIFIIWGGHYLFHFLLRYKFFNKIISYTSLTHYKFWGRYKAPKK